MCACVLLRQQTVALTNYVATSGAARQVCTSLIRTLALWINYICCAGLRHTTFLFLLLGTLGYLGFKIGYMHRYGTLAIPSHPQGVYFCSLQGLVALGESYMLNYLLRRWKADDWQEAIHEAKLRAQAKHAEEINEEDSHRTALLSTVHEELDPEALEVDYDKLIII